MANKQEIIIEQHGAQKTANQIGKVDRSIGGLTSATLKYAAAAGVVVGIAKKAIDAYGVQEQAEKRLEVAFKGNTSALKAQAAALQQVSTFGDEMILGVQASIAAFVDNEDAIKQATAATLDLAAATGMDLKSAGDLVAKSLGSSTNALSRYGIEVTGAVGSTERLDTLVGNIADKFEGQAAAAADTMAGSIQQAKNAMGDAAEVVGAALSPAITTLAKGIKGSVELLFGMNTEIDKLVQKSQQSTVTLAYPTWEQARANKALVETWKQLQEEAKILTPLRDEMRQIEIDTNIEIAKSIPLLKEQDEIVNDLRTSWEKHGAVMLENGLKGLAMADNLGEASRALANQYIVEGVFAATKSALENVPFPWNILAAGGAAIAANALFNTIVPSKSAASEMDEVITRPTLIRVGDNAGSLGERVTVSHAGGRQSGGSLTINFNGNVTDREYVRGFIIPEIEKAMRLNA